MNLKKSSTVDDMPCYITAHEAGAICNCTAFEILSLTERHSIITYVTPPISAAIFCISNIQANLLTGNIEPDQRWFEESKSRAYPPLLCTRVGLLKLGTQNCSLILKYGYVQKSIFESAIDVEYQPSANIDNFKRLMQGSIYALCSKEALSYVYNGRVDCSRLKLIDHNISIGDLRFSKSEIISLKSEIARSKKIQCKHTHAPTVLSDDDLSRSLHSSASDRLIRLVKLCRQLWFEYPATNNKFPARKYVEDQIKKTLENTSDSELKPMIAIITPEASKKNYSDLPITEEVYYLSQQLKTIIHVSNKFREERHDRNWIRTELLRHDQGFSENRCTAAQKIIDPTPQLFKAQERAQNKKSSRKNSK